MIDLLVEENDLVIAKGDLVLGDAQNQTLEMLLISKQGEWKQFPEAGCDIERMKNGAISRFMERNIKIQLEADGFQLKKMTITPQGIDITGKYGKT